MRAARRSNPSLEAVAAAWRELLTNTSRALRNFLAFVLLLLFISVPALIVVYFDSLHPPTSAELQARHVDAIAECVLRSIKSEVRFFLDKGFLTWDSYRKIVLACHEITKHVSSYPKDFKPKLVAPTVPDLIKKYPNEENTIRTYFRILYIKQPFPRQRAVP